MTAEGHLRRRLFTYFAVMEDGSPPSPLFHEVAPTGGSKNALAVAYHTFAHNAHRFLRALDPILGAGRSTAEISVRMAPLDRPMGSVSKTAVDLGIHRLTKIAFH